MTARLAAALAVGIVCTGGLAPPLAAADRSATPMPFGDFAMAGRDACRRALGELPLERMSPEARRVVDHYGASTTLHRRLPAETIRCDRALVEFVLDKPETLVDVWRVLGISRVSLDPTGAGTWRLSDGYGTTGTIRLLHRERGRHESLSVYHGQGGYAGPLSPRELTGSCLVVVRHHSAPDGPGEPACRVEIEAFLDVDGLGLEIVTRSLQPLIVRSAAANVHEISLFVGQFAAAATRNPAAVARLADRMPRTAATDRRRLVSLACGATGSPPLKIGPDTEADGIHEELAARWLPAEELDAARR